MKNTRLILGFVLGSAIVALAAYGLLIHAKQYEPASEFAPANRESFNSHWMDGLGEISTYELEQARYGEIHPGEMVVVFVHEPFSRKKLVKLDNVEGAGKDHVPVLKCLISTKFNTGLYPYSVETIAQTSLEDGRLLKLSNSSQEWCGHTWLQLLRRGSQFQVEGHSYFESEGEQKFNLSAVWSEDGFWNLIRFDPSKLPIGEIDVLPSLSFVRLRHKPVQPYPANARIVEYADRKLHKAYELVYREPEPRTVRFHYVDEFPYKIEQIEIVGLSGFGQNAKTLTTVATLTHQERLPYWGLNQRADTTARTRFGLTNTYE